MKIGLKLLTIIMLTILAWSRLASAAFIGGQGTYVPGMVRLGIEGLVGKCTGTLLTKTHILTAAHCIGRSASPLLRFEEHFIPVLNNNLEITYALLKSDKNTVNEVNTVKTVHTFPRVIFGTDTSPFDQLDPQVALEKLLGVGDFAIIELKKDVSIMSTFPKILFKKSPKDLSLLVGGFGRKGAQRRWSNDVYTGGNATFGEVTKAPAIELKNVAQDITYLGSGDSGGGVFQKNGDNYFVVALNHSSHYPQAQGLVLNINTGLVTARPNDKDAAYIGMAHYFSSADTKLVKWVSKILPKNTYIIE